MPLASFEPAELRRFTRAFEDFFYQADPESMTSYYTENAQLMADGITPIQGHDAIEQFWRVAMDDLQARLAWMRSASEVPGAGPEVYGVSLAWCRG